MLLNGVPVLNVNIPTPREFPDRYYVTGGGTCMAPILPECRIMSLFTNAPAAPGEFCCLWIRHKQEDKLQGRFKFLLMPRDGRSRFSMLNPPSVFSMVDPAGLFAAHRFVACFLPSGETIHADELAARFREHVADCGCTSGGGPIFGGTNFVRPCQRIDVRPK